MKLEPNKEAEHGKEKNRIFSRKKKIKNGKMKCEKNGEKKNQKWKNEMRKKWRKKRDDQHNRFHRITIVRR